jgi:hypothetical protein
VGIILNLIPVVETLLGYLCNPVSIIHYIDNLLHYFYQTQNLGGNHYNDSNFSFNKIQVYYNSGTDIDVVTPYSAECNRLTSIVETPHLIEKYRIDQGVMVNTIFLKFTALTFEKELLM